MCVISGIFTGWGRGGGDAFGASPFSIVPFCAIAARSQWEMKITDHCSLHPAHFITTFKGPPPLGKCALRLPWWQTQSPSHLPVNQSLKHKTCCFPDRSFRDEVLGNQTWKKECFRLFKSLVPLARLWNPTRLAVSLCLAQEVMNVN